MKTENSSNEQERMTDEQAYEQRLLDVLSYHQPSESSRINNQDAKFCVINGNAKNISWVKAGDELNEALERIYKYNSEDCFVSISEFKGEKLNKNYVASIKIFYIRLRKTERFNPSTTDEGKNIILKYCQERGLPTPTVIIYDGNEYILKWILREPLNGTFSLKLWKTVQKFLSERFFCLLDDRYYLEDRNNPKKKFIEAHSQATAMLRVPGFLKTHHTQGADLFDPKFETRIIFSSDIHYNTGEVAIKLDLSRDEIEHYRRAKDDAGGYLPKKSPSKKKNQPDEVLTSSEPQPLDEILTESMKVALITHHVPREQDTFIYVQRKNIEKHSRTDRTCFYDSYSVSELERFLRRTDINICDFFATAAEYKWGFYKLKEKKIFRTKENGERYEETRRQLPKREKWIEAIQLNFLHLNFRKSELGYIPTIEQAVELIYARCRELNLPKPIIVDTGDNGETLELRWTWQNAMKNCGERDNERIRYPRFNSKFDEMQRELLRLFWYFGADEKKISATSMLCVVGTPNTKTGNLRRIVGEADEILTYQDFAKRLGLNFDKVHEEQEERVYTIERPEQRQQQPKHDEPAKIAMRAPLEITETLNRAIEVMNPESPMFKAVAELANYVDFEVVMTKFFGNMYNKHMKTIEQINKLTDEKFRRVFGITRDTFFFILEKLDQQYADSHKKGSRPPKINTLNRLCIFLAYYRNYRTMEDIANEYGISVSTTYDIIRLVEKTLMSCEEFKLPYKQDLKEDEPKVVVIDATECEIRRTKRGHQTTIAVKRRNIRKKLK